jgi:hypothetical protein
VRIVKATQAGRHNKVKALQWLLTHSFSGKASAVKRVTEPSHLLKKRRLCETGCRKMPLWRLEPCVGKLASTVLRGRQRSNALPLPDLDHRAVKRITRPMLGFKSFWCAARIIAGIETMHMIKKGQLCCTRGKPLSAADHFYSLAF